MTEERNATLNPTVESSCGSGDRNPSFYNTTAVRDLFAPPPPPLPHLSFMFCFWWGAGSVLLLLVLLLLFFFGGGGWGGGFANVPAADNVQQGIRLHSDNDDSVCGPTMKKKLQISPSHSILLALTPWHQAPGRQLPEYLFIASLGGRDLIVVSYAQGGSLNQSAIEAVQMTGTFQFTSYCSTRRKSLPISGCFSSS